MHIAIDAAGGDFLAGNIIDGALVDARHLGFGLTLVCFSDVLEAELTRHPDTTAIDIRVVPSQEVIGMDEGPAAALRCKPWASVRVAAEIVTKGEAAAFFSVGNTGATCMAARAAREIESVSPVLKAMGSSG